MHYQNTSIPPEILTQLPPVIIVDPYGKVMWVSNERYGLSIAPVGGNILEFTPNLN